MEKYSRTVEKFRKSLNKFKEIVENPVFPELFKEEFLIEITTKRFEYTYESMWKAIKEFLRKQGIECNSPKSCFSEAIKEGIIPEEYERILSEIVMMRNRLVHIYDEESAKDLFQKIKEKEILNTFEVSLKGLEKEI